MTVCYDTHMCDYDSGTCVMTLYLFVLFLFFLFCIVLVYEFDD